MRCNSGAGLADGRGIDSDMDGRVSSILNLFAGRGASRSLSESSMIIGAFFLPRTCFGGCSSAWTEVSESDSLLLWGIFCLCLVELAVCGVRGCERVGGRICMGESGVQSCRGAGGEVIRL